jgi:hypothetical protein
MLGHQPSADQVAFIFERGQEAVVLALLSLARRLGDPVQTCLEHKATKVTKSESRA